MKKNKKKEKVIVAMSGGVDSSVAAALLKKDEYNVIGVHLKFWSEGSRKGNKCCTPESEKRARLVAKKLGIPFYVFNFEKEFKKKVVDYFLKANKAGFTPNPCVACNKEIKFGLLLEKALKLGADFLATGHYARLRRESPVCELLKGKDGNKDQSYFLWQLSQKQLRRVLFPIGDYKKEEVRKLAAKFKLPTAKTPESMETCFISTVVNDFLKKYLRTSPGDIIDKGGKIIGRHQGLWFYTIGQRKGIGLASGPYFVLDKNIKNNTLIVTKNEKDLYRTELAVKKVNWVGVREPKLPLRVEVKIRYRAAPSSAAIIRNPQSLSYNLRFKKAQRAVTPGQSAVFYVGEELIGGGIII